MSSTTATMDSSTRLFFIFFTILLSQQVASASTLRMLTDVEDVFVPGEHNVNMVPLRPATVYGRGLIVAIPDEEGEYPVVQLQHGFSLGNSEYEDLMKHVASWGFIVVAPQMYTASSAFVPGSKVFNLTFETVNARSILDWLEGGLIKALVKRKGSKYANYKPNWEKVALAGHSRGGRIVIGLALNPATKEGAQKYSAIIGLDPVDALHGAFPEILPDYEYNDMDVGVPTLIVGTGLGPTGGDFSCAPADKGHEVFYADVSPPSYHFVAPLQGHMDFTQDCGGFWPWQKAAIRCIFCASGGNPSRKPMRQFAGGITVAFLKDVLLNDNRTLLAALDQSLQAPVPILTPKFKLPGKKPQYV